MQSFETFATEDKAITGANGSIFGLAATVFTKDVDRAQRVARAIKAGSRAVARSYWSCEPTHLGGIEGIISR